MCQLAAIAGGVDPERYSLRELHLMAKAADVAAWCRTFTIVAQIFNANRDPAKTDPIDLMAYYPWAERTRHLRPTPPTQAEREELRGLFPKRR